MDDEKLQEALGPKEHPSMINTTIITLKFETKKVNSKVV